MSEVEYSSRLNFEKSMQGHSAVTSLNQIDCNVYRIERAGGRPPLVVRVEEIYIMSGCDVYEIMAENKNIDAIVLVGYYNRYTSDAKKSAKENGVALFRRDEFYGALHRTGKSFMNYVPRPKKDK